MNGRIYAVFYILISIGLIVAGCDLAIPDGSAGQTATPSPTASPTPSPEATSDPETSPTPTAESTAAPTTEPTESPSSGTPTPTAEATASPTPSPEATATPEASPTPTAEPTATPTAAPALIGFEGYTVGASLDTQDSNWVINYSDASAQVLIADNPVKTGSRSLRLYDDSTSKTATTSRTFKDGAAASSGTVKLAIYAPAAHNSTAYIALGTSVAAADRFIEIMFTAGGNVQVRLANASSASSVTTYTKDVWHTIEISWDSGTGKYSLNFDEGAYANSSLDVVFPEKVPTLFYLKCGANASTAGDFYVDDLSFSPASLIE